jgi:alkylation response protein AidB-like acyl-CoA dehydrogenase
MGRQLIVSARTSGGPRDRNGVSLFVVDRHRPIFTCKASRPSTAGAPPKSR